MFKPGDKVEVLDDALKGKVVSTAGDIVIVETSEGFLMEFRKDEIVKIEVPLKLLQEDPEVFSEVLKEKESFRKRRPQRVKPKDRNAPPMEVDLHIHKLTDERGMSNYDMLTLQTDTAKRQLEFAIKKRIQKVVFIHGVGEGVLRAELETLFHRYNNLEFYDADYQKYGLGATEVYIFQNP